MPCAGPKAGTWEIYKVKTAGKEGSPKNSSSLTTTYTQGFELSPSSLGGGWGGAVLQATVVEP